MELSVIKQKQPTDGINVDGDSRYAESESEEEPSSRLLPVQQDPPQQPGIIYNPTTTKSASSTAVTSSTTSCPLCSSAVVAHYCLSAADSVRYCTCRALSVCRGATTNARGGPGPGSSSRRGGGLAVTAVGRKISWTTFNVAIIFVLSLLLFLLSLSGNYPYMTNGKMFNNWNWNRMSRDNDPFSNYNMALFGKYARDYSRLRHSSQQGIAFQFTSKTYDLGVEPYKDCRMKQAKKFARKRQIVLPNRERFLIKPKFQSTKDTQTSEDDNPASTNELKLLLVVTYATNYSLRQKLRKWAVDMSQSATSSVDVEIIFIVTHSSSESDANAMETLKKEAKRRNDVLVSSLSGYPIISTLAFLTSGAGGQTDKSNSNYDFLIFIANENYTIGAHLITLLHFLKLDHTSQQNSQISVVDYYLQDLNVFGGLQCFDYEDAPVGRDHTSYSCYMDAFFCAAANSLVFMSTSLAYSLSDASWGQVPLLSDESRFLGYALEVADIEYKAIVLQSYIVNGKNHAASEKILHGEALPGNPTSDKVNDGAVKKHELFEQSSCKIQNYSHKSSDFKFPTYNNWICLL